MSESPALAIDIGGTRPRVALIDPRGGIVARASGATLGTGPGANVAAVRALTRESC